MQGLQPLHRYFEFHGRSGRAEFWQWYAITMVAGWIVGILDALNSNVYEQSHKFTLILALVSFMPSLTVGIRRFHDRGKSGWWYSAFLLGLAVPLGLLLIGEQIQRRNGDGSYIALGLALGAVWFVYAIYTIVQLAKPGDSGANAYGEPNTVSVANTSAAQPFASFAPKPPVAPTTGPLEQIERLAKLRDAGTLTEDEFQAQKATYLGRLA